MTTPEGAGAVPHARGITPSATDRGERHPGFFERNKSLVRELSITLVAVLLFAIFAITASNFFTSANIINIGRFVAFTAIVGVFMTFLFIAGEFDLSVGANFGFTSVFMAILIANHGWDPWLASGAAILLGAFIGLINGTITTFVGVPSFIVTLGMMTFLQGSSLVTTGAQPIDYPFDEQSSLYGAVSGFFLGIPAQIWWMFAVLAIGALVLKLTPFGYHVYATGGNLRAAKASGIATRRVKLICFVLIGASCGFISVLQGGWLKTADPTTGSGFELEVIAAVIIGGVALYGGEGSVWGMFIGAAILGMLANGTVLLGVDPNYTQLLVGAIIVVAAALDVLVRKRDSGAAQFLRRLRVRTGEVPG